MRNNAKDLRRLAVFTVFACFAIQAVFTPSAYGHGISGWGSQKTPDAPLTNVTKIAAGSNHSLALKSDGSLVGWGRDNYGQATPPAGTDFVAIAAGQYHSLALNLFVNLYLPAT